MKRNITKLINDGLVRQPPGLSGLVRLACLAGFACLAGGCLGPGRRADPPRTPALTAHRGGAGLAPENTLAAFQNGLAFSPDYLELDVHLSADGRLAVIHDPLLARTTDRPGRVADFAMAELAGFDAAARFFGPAFGRQRIPSLEEVLDLVDGAPEPKPSLQIEIKLRDDGSRYPGIEEALIGLLRERGMIERSVILCFDFPTLAAVAATEPRLKRCALIGRAYMASVGKRGPEAVAEEMAALGAEYVGVREDSLSRPLYDALRSRGILIGAWTVNDEARMKELIELGVDFITTDRPDLFRRLVPTGS